MIIFAHILNIFGLNNISDSGAKGTDFEHFTI